MDLQAVSRYPFRAESQEWIRDQGVSLVDVLGNPVYRRFVDAGLERVLQSMTEGGLQEIPVQDEDDAMTAVLSYPIARMLVSSVGDLLLIRRYALREAKLVHEFLVREDLDFLLSLAEEELSLEAEVLDGEDDAAIRVHFTDYLKNASSIRAKKWKLHNQDLREGKVRLGKHQFVRLMQEAMRRRIEQELPLEVTDAILEHLAPQIERVVAALEDLRSTIQKESYGEFSMDFMPPCMRTLLEQMQKGVNVPHMGRFALTAFLSHVGLDSEDILELFRASSDFKESIANYQVRHILGEVSGTRYTPPSCATMQTYGICLRDKRCERAGSPRRFYFQQQRRAERESGREAPAPGAEEEEEERQEADEGKGSGARGEPGG